MDNNDQIIKTLFEEVKQELNRQMQNYKTEIDDRIEVHVPAGNEAELKEFISSQKQYYEDLCSDEWGRPRAMKFSWDRYEKFVRDLNQWDELKEDIKNESRKRELVLHHTHLFIFSEIISYLHSLRLKENEESYLQQGHHKITILFQQIERRKNKKPTELDKRESAALYELLAEIKWFLGLDIRPKSNVATCAGIYSGFSIKELEKEIDVVNKQDKINTAKKLIKRLQEWLPPEK